MNSPISASLLRKSRVLTSTLWVGLLVSCGRHSTSLDAPIREAQPQPQPEDLQELALPLTQERPLALWKISREGVEPSWLFGTCHAGVVLDESLPEDREVLVREASLFVMELDMSSVDAAVVRQMLVLPDDQNLETILGEEEWKALIDGLDMGLMAGAFKRLHPFAIYAFVTQQMASEAGSASIPMDLVLSGMAQGLNIEAAYLETLAEQMEVFLGMDMQMWIQHIDDLGDPDSMAEMHDALGKTLDLCRTGDPSGFLELSADLEGSDKAFNDRLLRVRNENWIEPLDGYFQRGGVFAAVGAGHLFGEFSVPSLLEAEGWTVEQQTGITVDRQAARDETSAENP